MHVALVILALAALLSVVFEELIHINKAKTTLFIGTLSWLLAYTFGLDGLPAENITDKLNENLLEIASLWLFLMSAMTFVAYLNSRGFISNIVQHLLPESLHERTLMLLLGVFAFLFSSLADNVTATLVALAVITSLKVEARKRLKYATLVVFAVNSGGVSLITGDVTTLMIFLAGKVTVAKLLMLVLPSACGVLLLALMLSARMKGRVYFNNDTTAIDGKDKVIALIFLTTILSTLLLNVLFQVPPVLTFLFGLSAMFLIAQALQRRESSRNVLNYIREIEFDTLLFFLGVLLIVGILKEIGILNRLTDLYHVMPAQFANYLLGVCSALIDNVPLTAALLKADISMGPADWLAVTYSTGVGGSLLVIGSAAGIIAMSKVKELTFPSYLTMFGYLIAAYSTGYWLSVWVGRQFLGSSL
jgi:Na+/H+ antiporter NhaD/arsenite permease-like protein